MNAKIEKLKKFRQHLLAQLTDLTPEQWNAVPDGYRNNLVWNLAHLVCAQQSLCYLRSGEKIVVDDAWFSPYLTGTTPNGFLGAEKIEEIKALFISTLDVLQADLDRNLFAHYTASPNILNVYGIELKTIDDALDFLLYHEGFHSGYMLALKHLVG